MGKNKEHVQMILAYCKKKGIQSDPLPNEYVKAGWFLVPLKYVKVIRKEVLKFKD